MPTNQLLRVSAMALLLGSPGQAQTVEKQPVVSISAEDLKGGIVSEIMWDGGTLMIQGVFAAPTGNLAAKYLVVPAGGIELKPLDEPTQAALRYWETKSSRVSPTGLGRIESSSDTKLPQMGIGSLERRLEDAHSMGGMQSRHVLRLGSMVLLERTSERPPYDGEAWSWSPVEINRIAWVDGKGDLWVARADGAGPRRLLRGNYTLPAWSEDGRNIAVIERKDDGRRWDVSVVHLPEDLRRPVPQ